MDSRETIWKGWTIEERIGSGGAGDVYKIRRDEYGLVSYAAMKIIEIPRDPREVAELRASGMEDADIRHYYRELVGSLRKEIQIMEDLKGAPNIVSIEDYVIREHQDEIGWSIYIRMELLQSISDYRQRTGGLTLEEVLQLGVDMCTALENCREAGITHRDVKPDNIFRSRYGTFKLGDFGIARQLDSMTLRMHTHKGTTTYMAPEVIRKEKYDASVDLYSLGLVLYRYLNHNRMPYMPQYPERISPEDFAAALEARLLGTQMLPPTQADEELAAFVLKACAYAPEERYQSPEEFRSDLTRYLYSLREKHRAPGGAAPKDMYVAYDPQNMKQSFGEERTGLAGEETKTMVGSQMPETEELPPSVPPGEDPDQRQERPAEQEHHPKRPGLSRKWKALLIVALVFGVLAGGFVYLQAQYTRVPNVAKLPKSEAKAAIEKAGLTMGVDGKEYSDEVARNAIIRQSPEHGSIRRKQTVVHVVISKGTNKVTVPDLVGRTREDAEAALEEAHLKVRVELTNNILKSSGVVEQSVDPGSRVLRGTEVTITVNESTVRDHLDHWFGGADGIGDNGDGDNGFGDNGFGSNDSDEESEED